MANPPYSQATVANGRTKAPVLADPFDSAPAAFNPQLPLTWDTTKVTWDLTWIRWDATRRVADGWI